MGISYIGASKEKLGQAACCAVKRIHLDARIAKRAAATGADLKENFEVGVGWATQHQERTDAAVRRRQCDALHAVARHDAGAACPDMQLSMKWPCCQLPCGHCQGSSGSFRSDSQNVKVLDSTLSCNVKSLDLFLPCCRSLVPPLTRPQACGPSPQHLAPR